MGHIFISYAWQSEILARKIASDLHENGFAVWGTWLIDHDDNWHSNVDAALQETDALILLISPTSMNSPSVAKQYQTVLANDRPLIPVLVEPMDLKKISVMIRQFEMIDLTKDYDDLIKQIVSDLESHKVEPNTSESKLPKINYFRFNVGDSEVTISSSLESVGRHTPKVGIYIEEDLGEVVQDFLRSQKVDKNSIAELTLNLSDSIDLPQLLSTLQEIGISENQIQVKERVESDS